MNFWKGLVLDFRTLLGALIPNSNILSMLLRYEAEVDFRTPRVCLESAARTIEQTLERRGLDPAIGSSALEQLSRLVAPIDPEVYDQFEHAARQRLANDELNQWSVVALALAFEDVIWAQDEVLFGTGIPSWTTDTVEIYNIQAVHYWCNSEKGSTRMDD